VISTDISPTIINGQLNVSGNTNINGKISASNIPSINIRNKFRLADTGDEWLRMNSIDSTNYYGGLSANKLWTQNNTINGRNIFSEIDKLKTDLTNLEKFFKGEINFRLIRKPQVDNNNAYLIGNRTWDVWGNNSTNNTIWNMYKYIENLDSNITGDLSITGDANLKDLNVNNDATIGGNLNINGITTLNKLYTGNINFTGNNNNIDIDSSLDITKNTNIDGNLTLNNVNNTNIANKWNIANNDNSNMLNVNGNFAAGKLWTADNTINGIDIFNKIDTFTNTISTYNNYLTRSTVIKLRRGPDKNGNVYFKGDNPFFVASNDGWTDWHIIQA
jgi:hypothetical protein